MSTFSIFVRELRANLKSLLIWVAIMVLFSAVGFSKFTAFYNNPEMLAILDSMPQAMLSAFSMNAFNLTTVTGFFGIMAMYFYLMLAIAAAMWGSDIISKEERDKTVEYSLTLPVTRAKLVTAKIAAVVVNCMLLLYATFGFTLVNAQKYHPESGFLNYVFLSLIAAFMVQMVFMALGIFLGCALKQHKRSGSMAVTILLATYFAQVLYSMNNDLKFLKWLSPFQYFAPADLLRQNGLQFSFFVLSLVLIAGLLAGGYIVYSRRDLYI